MTRPRHWWQRGDDTLTPPPGHALPQQPSTNVTDGTMVGGRTRADVERHRAAAVEHLEYALSRPDHYSRNSIEWRQAIVDAYAWVLGERDISPVTETFTPGGPDGEALRFEDYESDDLACGRRQVGRASRTYANGVQHTVMWVRGETPNPPVDIVD